MDKVFILVNPCHLAVTYMGVLKALTVNVILIYKGFFLYDHSRVVNLQFLYMHTKLQWTRVGVCNFISR